MNLIRLCIARPVAVTVGVLLVVLFGLLALFVIPVQLTPNVDTPVVTVTTYWWGANPQEVEREITDRQEEQLKSVKGLRQMSSDSRDNQSQIVLEFYPHVDKDAALRDVNDKLRQVTGYPPEIEEPTIQAADSSVDTPIAWLMLRDLTNGGERIRELRDFAEDFVEPYLERVPGVAKVELYGGLRREVKVAVDPGRAAARGVSLGQIREALLRQNQNISAGTRTLGKRDYALRTVGQYTSPEEVLNTVVAATSGGPVYVRDVADVELGFERTRGFVRSQGQYVMAVPVWREVGTNVITVMNGVKDAIRRVNAEVLSARQMGIDLVQVYDETDYIRHSIDMVRDNILYGSALVLGLLLAFLRSWRATAVLALTIPVSIVGTFVVIVAFGRTLNVISLAGIAFAVGDVVDSAYVVLENIYRHKQMGKPVHHAVLDGTHEVWGPVLASTLTTMAVFIPVIFISQEAGQLFRDISIAEVGAVGLSMIVALTVIPPLAVRLLAHGKARAPAFPDDDAIELEDGTLVTGKAAAAARAARGHRYDIVLRFAGFMAAAVAWVNERRLVRWLVVVGMTAGSLALAYLLIPEKTYLPAGNRNLVFGFLLTPPGYSTDEFERMGQVLEARLRPYWEAEPDSPEHEALDRSWVQSVEQQLAAGAISEVSNPKLSSLERDRARREWLTPPPLIDNFFYVAWAGGAFMGCSSRDEERVKPLVRLCTVAGQQIPGVYAAFFQVQLFSFEGGNTAEIQIRGDDLEHVTAAASMLFMQTMQRFGMPRPTPANFNLGRPEVRIVPDRERAAELGLTAAEIGFIVEACGDGAYVGDYRQSGGNTIDIKLYIKGQQDRPTQEVAQVPIWTPSGQVVPLSAAARLIDTTALEQIAHVERQRAVTLTVTPPEALPLEAVIRQIKDEIEPQLRAQGMIHPSVLIALTGNADKLREARAAFVGKWEGWTPRSLINMLGGRFFLSVLIVYLLMCALYESWIYPFVIMFSVPLAILGGFLGLSVAHWGTLLTTNQPVQQFDMLTHLGFVMLVGLVVKNAILLVEQSLVNRREYHLSAHHAIREAVRVRVRPVLMTSLTSVFGLLPLALMPGAGTELYRGLAAVMLGGMIVSTLGTFILVPSVLGLVFDAQSRPQPGRAVQIATPAAEPESVQS
ncbi:MAG: efflux RND transporter permease subunit [Planctomycetota bacterium]